MEGAGGGVDLIDEVGMLARLVMLSMLATPVLMADEVGWPL